MPDAKLVKLTQGNLNNHHLYLTEVMDLFPVSAIGGSSESEMAPQLLEIHCGMGQPVFTDIDGEKKIFRKRSWVREFFEGHRLNAGDNVFIERTGPFRYHVFPKRDL